MRPWAIGSLMVVGAALSSRGMVLARQRGAGTAILGLALLSLTLWVGATLWAGLKIYFWMEGRKTRLPEFEFARMEIPATYTARYSVQDRVIAVLLAGFFCALAAFFAHGADHITGIAITTGFSCFSVCYAVHLIVSRVRFTRERITSRTWWRDELSEPYSSLRRVLSKPGTMTLHFSDGRLMKLYAGLGDSNMIVAYLSKHAPRQLLHTSERE